MEAWNHGTKAEATVAQMLNIAIPENGLYIVFGRLFLLLFFPQKKVKGIWHLRDNKINVDCCNTCYLRVINSVHLTLFGIKKKVRQGAMNPIKASYSKNSPRGFPNKAKETNVVLKEGVQLQYPSF